MACLGPCRWETHRPLQCIWAHSLASVRNRGGEREGISPGNGPGFERDGWGCRPHRHHGLAQKEGRSPRSTANPRTTGTHKLSAAGVPGTVLGLRTRGYTVTSLHSWGSYTSAREKQSASNDHGSGMRNAAESRVLSWRKVQGVPEWGDWGKLPRTETWGARWSQ